MDAQGALKVGEWIVEPDLNQLSARGRSVKVEPKTMAVLLCLAPRPGQVVGREELLSQVWPGVVVGDDSLTQVIIRLRKALGDDPEQPTYVQTVTKKGYRLVAPVRPAPGTEVSATPRSEEHTSELQSLAYLVCRLLLENNTIHHSSPQPNSPRSLCASDWTSPRLQ